MSGALGKKSLYRESAKQLSATPLKLSAKAKPGGAIRHG